jgi:hypothetical protein
MGAARTEVPFRITGRENPMLVEVHGRTGPRMTIATNAPEMNVRTPMVAMAQAAPNRSVMMPAAKLRVIPFEMSKKPRPGFLPAVVSPDLSSCHGTRRAAVRGPAGATIADK